MRRKSHVRFCSGGGVGDHPTDRNQLTPQRRRLGASRELRTLRRR